MSDFTSCLRYPRFQSFVQLHDWQLFATDGDKTAAALLSVFEHKHNKILEDRDFAADVREAARAAGLQLPPDFKFWFAFTDKELFRRVKICKDKKVLYTAIALLERKGFIQTNAPEELVAFMKTGRRKWFRFLAHKIQPVIDAYDFKMWGARASDGATDGATDQPDTDQPKDEKTIRFLTVAREVFDDWRKLISPRSLDADETRLQPVVRLLKKGATKERLLLATRGVLLIPHNVGATDGRLHVGFDLIFRNADYFEKYERAALDVGLTEENFQDFVISLKDLRLRPAAEVEQEKASKKKSKDKPSGFVGESPAEAYRLVAEIIADGVSALLSLDQILFNVGDKLSPEDFFIRERLIEATRAAAATKSPLDKAGLTKVEKIVGALIDLQKGL